jgi:hypothetical protein
MIGVLRVPLAFNKLIYWSKQTTAALSNERKKWGDEKATSQGECISNRPKGIKKGPAGIIKVARHAGAFEV